jgi:chromosome segregation ATPase
MPSKLDKAKMDYEKLLCDLGQRAEMLDLLSKEDESAQENLVQAREQHNDRKLELDFLTGEIHRMEDELRERQEKVGHQIKEMKEMVKKTEKSMDVKKSKTAPVKTKLSGAEYDLRFVERALAEEMKKLTVAEENEDDKNLQAAQNNIKRLKIDILKRKKEINGLRQQMKSMNIPTKGCENSVEEMENKISGLELEQDQLARSEEKDLLQDLIKQQKEKEHEIEECEALILERFADIGEGLYARRVRHSVLEKYYSDLDRLTKVIDQLAENK